MPLSKNKPVEAMPNRGARYEREALALLQQAGLTLVTQNYRIRGGEIDLIMLDQRTLVFIEVRYRKHGQYGSAGESITPTKQARIIRTAEMFLAQHPTYGHSACRFDAVLFDQKGATVQHTWIKAAFDAG